MTPEEQEQARQRAKEKLELSMKQLEVEKKIAEALKSQRDLYDNSLSKLESQLSYLKEFKENSAALTEAEIGANIELQSMIRDLRNEHAELLSSYSSNAEILENIDKIHGEINSKIQKNNRLAQEYDSFWGSIATKMGMGKNYLDNTIKSMTRMSAEMENDAEAAERFALSFKEAFSTTTLMTSILTKMAEATMRVAQQADEVATSFAKATGFGDEYKKEIIDAGQAYRDMGIGMKESGEAYTALILGTTNFVNISGKSREAMAQQSAMLQRIGVDYQTQTGLIQFFNLNLEMSATAAVKATQKLALMGKKLGIGAAQMTKEYLSSLKVLAVYGDKSIDVYTNLAVAAKRSGVELSSLLGVVQRFDTFADAAQNTAKLNALLGTQLSASNMLLQTEDQRLETLISTIQASGTAFNDMDRFTKKAVAAAAGITDMNEAQKIFSMNMGEYKAHQSKVDDMEASQQRMREAVEATIPVQEMLVIAFSEFAVALLPVLEYTRTFLSYVITTLEKMPEGVKQFIASAAALGLMFKVLGPVVSLLGSFVGGLTTITAMGPASAGVFATIAAGLRALGTAIGHPKIILGLTTVAALLYGAAMAYEVYAEAQSKTTSMEAKQQEAIARQIEGLRNLQGASAELAAIKREIAEFGDIDVNAKAVLTNLAFITAGKAADSATSVIVSGQAVDVVNNLENVFQPQVKITLDGDALRELIREEVINIHGATQ